MRKVFTLLSLFLLLTGTMLSQTAQRNCGTMQHLNYLKSQDEGLEDRMNLIEQQTAEWVQNSASMKTAATVVNIPVVVHVVYNTTSQNITDAQIKSQIDVLNEDFRKLNADRTLIPVAFAGLAADVEITFCLASKSPSGATSTGIIRKSTTVASFSDDNSVKYTSSGGSDAWNTSQYLNLWVCNLGGGLLGYAQFPGGPAATDGVVILYSSFGRTGTVSAPYDKGRTATHEVGHWLNLRHIWGDAACGSDLVNDTPTQQTSNGGCPAFPHITCSNGSNGDMFMNYMDYTNDACMYMFSTGQKSRMQSLFAAGGARASLLTSAGCGGTTTSSASNTLTIGTGTGTGTTVTPYGTYYMDEKVQYIITKAELVAAGYSSTNNIIKSLAFNVASASTQVMNGFTIKVRHTTAAAFGSTTFLSNTNMTTVYSANTTASVGWKTHSFTTPFTYNGTDNLLVEICFDNSAYSTDTKTYFTTTSTYNTLYLRSDVAAGGVCVNTTGSLSYSRPNMRLAFSSSTAVSTAVLLEQPKDDIALVDNISTLRTIPKNGSTIDFQLAPNPASSFINVNYSLDSDNSAVNIKLYNMMGKLIADYNPQNQTEGKQNYEVDLTSITSADELQGGVYLCALSINGEIQTKKFMLIK
ncbi:MAG: T9SS type A sorting domain-containing protein [Burkholderiales bacterium]|nr:T9SS type A sorting domain-containing protein [Bacteroidia bacterium]